MRLMLKAEPIIKVYGPRIPVHSRSLSIISPGISISYKDLFPAEFETNSESMRNDREKKTSTGMIRWLRFLFFKHLTANATYA
ncbi:hypothetical protein Pan161_47390 [Gimesia algae]|uniref:Uncharacterized protein n=1 Tax=Gimesia algae TaxID=2527971 RepID=A0A517VJ92_9PLAN|nr:hypothetical protein Pan161_47390 [Gimesia algae]